MSDMALASNVRALLSGFTQDTRLIRLTTPLGVDLLAECVQGEEGIGQDYSLKIDAGARTLA
jgi:type VI secretion system secreted protein VgrG